VGGPDEQRPSAYHREKPVTVVVVPTGCTKTWIFPSIIADQREDSTNRDDR
jgi:hypothetical protein